MSNVTITNLPAALSVTGTDKIPAVQNGTTVYVTASQIGTYFNANYPFPTISAGYLIGNATTGTAVAAGVSYSSLMDIAIGSTQGQMIYRNVGNWVAINPGVYGQVLSTGGPSSDPFWATLTGSGTVFSIGIGTNLISTQTPITTTGTISTVMDPAFTTSVTTPSIFGGSSVSQTLLIQSTTGIGTSDSIVFKVGNNGAITALSIDTSGVVTLSSALPVTSGGTGQTSALTTNGVVYGLSATAMATTAAGTTGQVLVATTSGAPSFGAIPSTAAVTSISFGTIGLTPASVTTGAVTVAGTLVAANGGTGVNNGSSTLTMAGNVTYAGVFTQTFTATGNTSVTLPTSGTLVNTAVTTLSSLSSIGTVTTGTWNATAIGPVYGGTGITSYTTGDILYASGANTLANLPVGTNGAPLTLAAGIPSWGGTIGVAFGGTGATTVAAAQTNLQVDPAGTAVAMAIALG